MILSVTVLGSNDGTSLSAIGQRIVEYLEGGRAVARRAPSGQARRAPFARGRHRRLLRRLGRAPPRSLGAREVGRGRPGRARHAPRGCRSRDRGAAHLGAGIGKAGRTDTSSRARTDPSRQGVVLDEGGRLGPRDHSLPTSVACFEHGSRPADDESDGIKIDATGAWQINKDAVVRISEHREPPKVVAGYDLTFSVPKSVSVLWAGGRRCGRAPRSSRRSTRPSTGDCATSSGTPSG